MKAEINRDIELVQVLLYLSEQQDKTIQCINNKTYTTAISEWFAAYRNHPAVQITKDLICNENFIHIRPLQAILSLKDIIANPEHPLYAWVTAVIEFQEISGFDAFFESQTDYYTWILDHIASCDFDTWVGFIDAYFRQKPDEFRLVVCPIAGNYGFSMEENGKNVAYTVRFMPKYDESGTPDWNFDFFAKGIAHEWGEEIHNVFEAVDEKAYFDSIWYDIECAEEDILENPVYVILNLCRVLAFKKEKLILSKQEGGTWGLVHVPEKYSKLIQQALDEYASVGTMKLNEKEAVEYAKYMIAQITA